MLWTSNSVDRSTPLMTSPPHPLGPPAESIGIYVHFPWCIKKCPYCDFLSIPGDPEHIPHQRYADQVITEMAQRAEEYSERAVHSVFFGGGTPSLWEPRALGRVLEALFHRFPGLGADAEITVECNPGSLTRTKAEQLRAAGVNRLSIGVQSLSAERLAFLGRWHDASQALAAIDAAQRAGFQRVSADMIIGVSGQSAEEAVTEITTLAGLGLEHLSAYTLTLEPGTRFHAQHKQGRLPLLPEEEVARCFVAVRQCLTERGFRQYEISNYAKPDAESRHNLGYWLGNDYVGLGTGAFGTWTTRSAAETRGLRYRNTLSVERYLAQAFKPLPLGPPLPGQEPTALTSDPLLSVEHLTAATLLSERLMLGLRTDTGVLPAALAAALGVPVLTPERLKKVQQLQARGRLRVAGDRWVIPSDQWLFSDDTIARLL